ncbi:hypothetical protein FS749_004249 [Ceratobasidium sp. UAMH 11750]|nr:hypothetical protein FS749_004249 [Ceratobasidium sp. UAMH 11750]
MLAAINHNHNEETTGANEWLDSDWTFVGLKDMEDGMDVDTEELGVVMDYSTGEEIKRRIAFPGAHVELAPAAGPFYFQKVFGDSDFFAGGVIKIPVGGQKRNKHSRDNTFAFYCITGTVEVKVHKSTFTVAPGGMFLVPRGNVYAINNVSQCETFLFFTQARKVPGSWEGPPPLPQEAGTSGEAGKAQDEVVPAV